MKQARKQQKIVCIVGPTACHKTECSIELAKRVDGEIVSADSVQVYFGMDIGSAKPDEQERQGVPHHLIDCIPIDTPEFSVSMFRDLTIDAIHGISSRNHVPIVVGGSGLYVSALTFPLGFAIPQDREIRETLLAEYEDNSNRIFERLMQADPETAKRLHPNDKKRIVRALEVFEASGRPLSSYGDDFMNASGEPPPFLPLMIGLNMDRSVLYDRINRRVDLMIERGLLDEAKRIYDAGYSRSLPAMRSIGYQQLFAYFKGEVSLSDAIEKIKQDTRRFAKRQLTWFRRDERIRWLDATNWDANRESLLQELALLTQRWMEGKNI